MDVINLILKKKKTVRVWTGFIWIRNGASGGFLWTWT